MWGGRNHPVKECPALEKNVKHVKTSFFSQMIVTFKKVNESNTENNYGIYDSDVDTIKINFNDNAEEFKFNLEINKEMTIFKINTGAEVNTISRDTLNNIELNNKLTQKMEKKTHTNTPTLGKTELEVTHKKHILNFYKTQHNSKSILGLKASNKLKIMNNKTRNRKTKFLFSPSEHKKYTNGRRILTGKCTY